MRPRRRSYPWGSMLGIDGAPARGGAPMRNLADAPTASAALSIFSGVAWMIAAGMMFLDLRAGAVAGAIATLLVLLSARRA